MTAVRARASAGLDVELKTDRAYAELAATALSRATAYQRKADVRALESVGFVMKGGDVVKNELSR